MTNILGVGVWRIKIDNDRAHARSTGEKDAYSEAQNDFKGKLSG